MQADSNVHGHPWFRMIGTGIGPLAAHMDEMDGHAVHFCAELREAVDACFLRTPVETVLPVVYQFTQVRAVDSVRPIIVFRPGRPVRVSEAGAKLIYFALRHIDLEWLNLHYCLCVERVR
jgi:hypothetical protein